MSIVSNDVPGQKMIIPQQFYLHCFGLVSRAGKSVVYDSHALQKMWTCLVLNAGRFVAWDHTLQSTGAGVNSNSGQRPCDNFLLGLTGSTNLMMTGCHNSSALLWVTSVCVMVITTLCDYFVSLCYDAPQKRWQTPTTPRGSIAMLGLVATYPKHWKYLLVSSVFVTWEN